MTTAKYEQRFFLAKNSNKENQTKRYCVVVGIVLIVAIAAIVVGVVLLLPKSCKTKDSNNKDVLKKNDFRNLDDYCELSHEAKRIELQNFLLKCQRLYFQLYPHEELVHQRNAEQKVINSIARKFKVYDPSPQFLKNFADERHIILEELVNLKPDESLLKPKENQIMSEIRVFLQQSMAAIYDVDFYNGDWMFGPNYFCQNRICSLMEDINTLTYYFRPETTEDIDFLIKTFNSYNKTFNQYIENMRLGVKVGMVKSQLSCKAGLDAFKDRHINIVTYGEKSGILESHVSINIRSKTFYSFLPAGVKEDWEKRTQQSVRISLLTALIHGYGKAVINFYDYLKINHARHCPPDDVASGVSSLPLDYVYVDEKADVSRPTTKRLPITDTILDGKDMYRRFVESFTTLDISPEEIYEEGKKQLDLFYPMILNISKDYTQERNVTNAVNKMKSVLNGDDQWHGMKFPANESDVKAHLACVNDESAQKYCPVRWKALAKWKSYMNNVMSMIHPQLYNVFHFTGPHISVPNCPIKMQPHYNPSNGAMYFESSDIDCTTPTYFGLPFFLEKYGPRFQEWSVNGHEARPGHHFQYQGAVELFSNPCTNNIDSFFHSKGYFTGFVEGWALYTENPVLSDDVDLYRDNILQKLGMYKWQIWRAVRLVVDTGLHYRQLNRTWALKQFEDYAWDTTDFARKEITRYMSCPGQATAYMIGRLAILKARRKAEKELSFFFNLKDFHYQILSIGQAPLEYMTKHIDRWIQCVLKPTLKYCDYILKSVKEIPKNKQVKKTSVNMPYRAIRHFL